MEPGAVTSQSIDWTTTGRLQRAMYVNSTVINEYNYARNGSNGTRGIYSMNSFQTRVVPSFYLIISIIGLLGNGVVIAAIRKIRRKNRSKSVNDILVINLALADFIFVGGLPFWATQEYLYKRWVFGMVGCKLLSFNTLLNLYASVFFIVAMGMDRCFAVVFAINSYGRRTERGALVACIVIWTSAVAVASLALVFREVTSEPPIQCVWVVPDEYVYVHYVFRVAVGFFIPFGIMMFSYVMIIVKLNQKETTEMISGNQENLQKKITTTILAVMSLFVVCWLPNHIVTVMAAITSNDADKRIQYGVQTANAVSVCLAYANSALNPILYAFMKGDIRNESKKMIRRYMACLCLTGRGIDRARKSISRFRAIKLSIRRPTTATAVTTVTRYKDARVNEQHDFPMKDHPNPELKENSTSYCRYEAEYSDGEEKVNLTVKMVDEC